MTRGQGMRCGRIGADTFRTAAIRSLVAGVAISVALPTQATTFTEAMQLVAARHPQVEAAGLTVAAGRADVDAARAPKRPQVALVGDVGYERRGLTQRSDTAWLPGVRATQLLYDGGRTSAEVTRRKLRAEALAAERDRTVFDVAQRLSDAYLEWSRQKALLAIADEQVTALRDVDSTVRAIAGYDRGRASDVSLVATRLAQAEAARDSRRAAIEDARAAVRQAAAADIEPTGEMAPVDKLVPRSLEEALVDVERHPSVRSARFQAREAVAQVDAAAAWWKPQLSLDAGSASESAIDGRTKLFGTVELKLRSALTPIDGGGGSARLASARATASAARVDAAYAERALTDEITRSWVAMTSRQARLPGLTALVGISDASRGVVSEQFKIGRRSILDLLTYELDRFSVRSQLESERRDLMVAQYRLLSATGRLVSAFAPDAAPPAREAHAP